MLIEISVEAARAVQVSWNSVINRKTCTRTSANKKIFQNYIETRRAKAD